jgi:hypothetical protein
MYTFLRDRKTEARLKLLEKEQERERAEAALRRSKAAGPCYELAKKTPSAIYFAQLDGHVGFLPTRERIVLSAANRVADQTIPKNERIVLLLANIGSTPRMPRVAGEIAGAEIEDECDEPEAHGLSLFAYPYDPESHGKVQKVEVSFETHGGERFTHIYETRHGFFEFRRIDPP